MNDRYLYKGKDKDDGKWYEGYYLLLHDTTYCCMPSDNIAESKRFDAENTHHYIVFEQMTDWGLPNKHLRAEILPETLCQCTGLKDKNGKLIWENDIVAYWDSYSTENGQSEADCVGKVVWDDETISFQVTNRLSAESYEVLDECSVIGNIFDNPELLEAGKEAGDHGDQDLLMPAT